MAIIKTLLLNSLDKEAKGQSDLFNQFLSLKDRVAVPKATSLNTDCVQDCDQENSRDELWTLFL